MNTPLVSSAIAILAGCLAACGGRAPAKQSPGEGLNGTTITASASQFCTLDSPISISRDSIWRLPLRSPLRALQSACPSSRDLLIIFVIIALLFWAIFKALPDGKITGKHTLYGAMFTAFLFMIGKTAIGIYLGNSNVASGYGAAGSLIVVLLWVYYSANILYFGASFTKVYAHADGKKIIPNKYAVYIEQKETEKEPRLKYNNGEVEREAAE